MTGQAVLGPPRRRPELVVRPVGAEGRCVVKNPRTGEYFQLGPQEAFLLERLDGRNSADDIRQSFERQFHEPLPPEDFDQFLALARHQRLVQTETDEPPAVAAAPQPTVSAPPQTATAPAESSASWQSLLYWRRRLFDPDRLFNRLEPLLRWIWTPMFLALSAAGIVAAAWTAWAFHEELVGGVVRNLSWETLVLAWLTTMAVALCHECAHGLTCKHFGGEVHEIGFLLIFLMPGLYCNVSDAWLFREKSRRLWVTFAGGYCDLVLWGLAVGLWRLTAAESTLNYLAGVVVAVTGLRSLINFAPFLKLDGYYLLSDYLEIPNLRQRAIERFEASARWLLWGAPRPAAEPRGRMLLLFGMACWGFSVLFLGVMLAGIGAMLRYRCGPAAWAGVALLGLAVTPGLVRGFLAGQVTGMIRSRKGRTLVWAASLGGLVAVLSLVEIHDRYGGPFELRPVARADVRAPIAGFVREVRIDEGDEVSPGAVLIRLEIPDLESRLAQKRAAIREAEADLHLIEAGTRPEKITEQERLVQQARGRVDLAKDHLARQKTALEQDLVRLDQLLKQREVERTKARADLERSQGLLARRAVTHDDYEAAKATYEITESRWLQAQSEQAARRALGTLEAEQQLAQRERELSEAESALTLMKLDARAEELAAARARVASLRADLQYLEELEAKQEIVSPIPGTVVTPHVREVVGRYVQEGELICEVEDRSALEVKIEIAEQDAARIGRGRPVGIKLRALPYDSFEATVVRIAPRAVTAEAGQSQSRVPVYCRLENPEALFRSQMTGYARIYTDPRPLGAIGADRLVRLFRTEFWW